MLTPAIILAFLAALVASDSSDPGDREPCR